MSSRMLERRRRDLSVAVLEINVSYERSRGSKSKIAV